jgi:hypothetical protein
VDNNTKRIFIELNLLSFEGNVMLNFAKKDLFDEFEKEIVY